MSESPRHPDVLVPTHEATEWGVPSEGEHDAVLADWWRESSDRVRLLFQVMERGPTGYRRCASETMTWSMNPTAKLRRFLEAWRGRPFTKAELYETGIWIELYVGQPAHLSIAHVPWKPDRPWARIASIRPWDYQCGRLPPTVEGIRRRGEKQQWPT